MFLNKLWHNTNNFLINILQFLKFYLNKKNRVATAIGVASSRHQPLLYHVILTWELYKNYQNLTIYRLKQPIRPKYLMLSGSKIVRKFSKFWQLDLRKITLFFHLCDDITTFLVGRRLQWYGRWRPMRECQRWRGQSGSDNDGGPVTIKFAFVFLN